jgi:hypothetical protein
MDKIKLVIKRIGNTGSRKSLEFAYGTESGFKAVDKDFNPITYEEYQKGVIPYKITFNAGEVIKPIQIDLSGKNMQPHTEQHKIYIRHSRLYDMILNHPQVFTENKRVSNPNFELVDEYERSNRKVQHIKNVHKVLNYINSMSHADMVNLCVYLRKSVFGLTMEQVYTNLLSFEPANPSGALGGLHHFKGWAFEDIERTLSMKTDPDAELKIFVNKAVALGIIENRSGLYYYGNVLVSDSQEKLYMYFKDNPTYLENGIKKSVIEKDTLPILMNKDIELAEVEEMITNQTAPKPIVDILEKESYDYLLVRAKDLGIPGFHKMKLDTLRERVGLAEKNELERSRDLAEKAK